MRRKPWGHNSQFIRREQLTPPLRRLIDDLRQVAGETDIDTPSRVYASATAQTLCETWASQLGLRRSPGHACLGRVRDGVCWGRRAWRYGASQKERIPCDLPTPAADHTSLWNKDGKPYVYVSQPYQLSWEPLLEVVKFGERWGLSIDIKPWPSWHFPSRVLSIFVRREGPRRLANAEVWHVVQQQGRVGITAGDGHEDVTLTGPS
jgi:hypothetical protein